VGRGGRRRNVGGCPYDHGVPESIDELTAEEARRLQLRAQGLLGRIPPSGAPGGPVINVMRHLGAVQLDTISVLARSHELVPYARLGAVGRDRVEKAYWGKGLTFEYWSHAACILPVQEWPFFGFRRRAHLRRGRRWHKVSEQACTDVLTRLRSDGPLTSTELGGAKRSSEWWDWSDTKIAVEWLLDIGEVVCVRRIGWRRVYDLPERALPADLTSAEPDDDECITRLVGQAGRALGVATRADLADYHRLKLDQVDAVIEATGLVPVTVAGWIKPAWADAEALATTPKGRHRTTLLSPFDSLVWDRKRSLRMFGFDHRLEAYVPKDKRIHGYFTMPLLAGGRLIGRVDPGREGNTLVARQVSLEPTAVSTPAKAERAVTALATALFEAAGWVGCDQVRVDRIDPVDLLPSLGAALKSGDL
jgi:uncharacterized protein